MEYSQKKATGKNRIYICVRLFLLSRLMFYFASASPLGISSNKGVSKCICSNPWCAAVAAQIQHMQQLHLNRTAPVLIWRKCNICFRRIFREPFRELFGFLSLYLSLSQIQHLLLLQHRPQHTMKESSCFAFSVAFFTCVCLCCCLCMRTNKTFAQHTTKHLNIWIIVL